MTRPPRRAAHQPRARVVAVHGVLPAHRYDQDELAGLVAGMCLAPGADDTALRRLYKATQVQSRCLAMPAERYPGLRGFGEANAVWLDTALELGEQAVLGALHQAGLEPGDVDVLVSTTVTGLAVPSLDARLAVRLGMRSDVRRLPLFGLGCVAGAAGIARLHDHLRAWPQHVAVLLSVELCSLTLQRGDSSGAALVAGALFGDGAAAVVAVGDEHERATMPGPYTLASRASLYPDTERVMGWDIDQDGFHVVLSTEVPDVVRARLADDVGTFLSEHRLTPEDVAVWVCHPGGPKVLDAVAETLHLPPTALELTWRSLAAVGNLSSASVLHVLRDTMARPPAPGSWGVLMAMGPGFCSELVLLQW